MDEQLGLFLHDTLKLRSAFQAIARLSREYEANRDDGIIFVADEGEAVADRLAQAIDQFAVKS